MNRVLKNHTGYDLKHLFVGSEGTLGIVTHDIIPVGSAELRRGITASISCRDGNSNPHHA